MIVAETTVYFGTTWNAHSFFVEDFQSDALYWYYNTSLLYMDSRNCRFFTHVHQVIWNILGKCEVFMLNISSNKNFQYFIVENLWFAIYFLQCRGASNWGISTAAERGGGHQLGAAKPQATSFSGGFLTLFLVPFW